MLMPSRGIRAKGLAARSPSVMKERLTTKRNGYSVRKTRRSMIRTFTMSKVTEPAVLE